MQVILYKSLTCPQCKVIQMKMDKKGLQYEMITDIDVMTERGIKGIPTLEVDGERITNLTDINKWVNAQEAVNG